VRLSLERLGFIFRAGDDLPRGRCRADYDIVERLGGLFVVPLKGITQLFPHEAFNIIERQERTLTAESFISGDLKLKMIAFGGSIVSYFWKVLLVTGTPQSIALE